MNKRTLLVIVTIIAVIFMSCLVFIAIGSNRGGGYALITSDGKVVEKINLAASPDRTFEVKTELGSNTIRVQNGKISVIEADCPDKKCVAMGELDSAIMPIVCLPHKLMISLIEE